MRIKSLRAIFMLLFCAVFIVSGSVFADRARAAEIVAKPTVATVFINGVRVSFDAYAVNDNNYFKLRDLAYVLSGTAKRFSVEWNGENNAIMLIKGETYEPVGGEMSAGNKGDKTAWPTKSRILLGGDDAGFTAYNISGNNYFKLRDIGAAFDFGVDWDGASNAIAISTDKSYMSEGEVAVAMAGQPIPDIPAAGMSLAEVTIGMSVADAERGLGSPYRVVDGERVQYRFYGEDYSRFMMLAAEGGKVAYAYANYDIPAEGDIYKLFEDTNGGRRVYAASVGVIRADSLAVAETLIFEATNAFRAFHGMPALLWDEALASAARTHSADMVKRSYFDHYSPEKTSPGDRILANGYRWSAFGENISLGHSIGVYAVEAWVHSSGHRSNLLHESFSELGVGCAGNISTQNFGNR
jgi:hypothetical protein